MKLHSLNGIQKKKHKRCIFDRRVNCFNNCLKLCKQKDLNLKQEHDSL